MTTRASDSSLDIAAPQADVWTALTDPDTLTRWFATHAEIDLAPGGRYAISWHGDWPWTMRVVECVPGVRLVLRDDRAHPFDVDGQPLDDDEPVTLTLAFHLTPSASGGTVVRVVHAGFGQGSHWDDELDGVSTGWPVELHVLRHYLERCGGRQRSQAWARASVDGTPEALWDTLTTTDVLLRNPEVFSTPVGARARLRFSSGDAIEGPVLFSIPNRHLLVQADNAADGLLNVTVSRAGGRSMVQVVLATWALPPEEVSAFERRIQMRLDTIGAEARTMS